MNRAVSAQERRTSVYERLSVLQDRGGTDPLQQGDIDPQAPTHFLVIPKMHIASVAEVTQDNAAVVAHIFAVISKVTKELGLESYRVVSNIGEQAGQSVPHLHFHVLSGRDMTWPPG